MLRSIFDLQLENNVNNGKLVLTSAAECDQLHHTLRDFASVLQLIGRLSILFVGGDDAFEANLSKSVHIVNRITDISVFGSSKRLYMMETQVDELATDLILA